MSQLLSLPLQAVGLLGQCALEPFVSGPLLAFLLYAPPALRQRLLALAAGPHQRFPLGLAQLTQALSALVTLGVVRRTNRALNAWATNQWQVRARGGWHWPAEVAVVTGGCSGIGRALALALAGVGVRVAVLDVASAPADLTAHPRIAVFSCDVSSPEAVAEVAAAVRAELGAPSILVNNAGITGSHTILATPPAFVARIFGANVMAHWNLVREFVPHMVAQDRGHVVTVASMASFITNSANVDYTATKAAALAFHEGLTSELRIWYRAPGIATTIVHPGFVRTPLIEESVLASGQGEAAFDGMLTPEEVAQSILKQILARRGAQIILPASAAPISWLKGLPNWVQEGVRELFGRMSAKYGGSVIAR